MTINKPNEALAAYRQGGEEEAAGGAGTGGWEMSGQKNDVTYAATVAFAVAKMRELGWMPPSNTSTDPPQDDLIERLRSVSWDVIDDGDRMPDDPTLKCVFVDMRPDEFESLLTEAAAALEAAREDACVSLVADIRRACGDNFLRMRPELVEYIRELAEDAERFRWLTEDHADAETRSRCREILDRMAVMSYSAAIAAIDAALAAQQQEKGNG